MKGRQRRLKNFQQRADAFLGDLAKWRGFTESEMDGRIVLLGKGMHKRLIMKRNPFDLAIAKYWIVKAKKLISENPPKNFTLVGLKTDNEFRVQEYRNAPSVSALQSFFQNKFLPKRERTEAEVWEIAEALKCKRLANQFRGITPEKLRFAFDELANYGLMFAHKSNVLVLGQEKDGSIRLAICDV